MNPLILELVNRDIEVSLIKRDGEIVWDLNSGTKSGMYMSINETAPFTVTGRYGEKRQVHNLDDLAYAFAVRFSDADHFNWAWVKLARDLDFISS